MQKNTFFHSENTRKTIILGFAGLVGLICIVFSGFISSGDLHSPDTNDHLSAYISDIETRLCKIISGIDGAGETAVFVNAENSFETVYASNATVDQSESGNGSSKVSKKSLAYTTGTAKEETPVIIKTLCPKIGGVLVVCEGGMNQEVRDEIISAVSAAIGISTSKIYVTGGLNKP